MYVRNGCMYKKIEKTVTKHFHLFITLSLVMDGSVWIAFWVEAACWRAVAWDVRD